MVSFGVGYALASLSCTFGVLLAVIAQAQAAADFAGIVLVFGVYAAGSAAVLLLLTILTAVAGTALTRRAATLARYGPRVTAVILLITGVYLAWYWDPSATGAATTTGGWIAGLSAAASSWVQANSTLLAILALVAIAVVIALTIHQRGRARIKTDSDAPRPDRTLDHSNTPSTRNNTDPHCC
jgi:cytochrome c biogenesis protein CcdA